MSTILGGAQCCDPATLKKSCELVHIPIDKWWGKANRFDLTAGRQWGTGWVLLTAAALDSLDLAADHALTFLGTDTFRSVTLSPITLLHFECVTPGSSLDAAAVYLCEVVDRRWHLAKVPLDRAYNVKSPEGTSYLAQTTNGSSAWTWQQIVTDLTTILGMSTLTLPFTPDGTPENMVYYGSWAWTALNDLCDRLACVLQYDPVTDTFAIVRLGVAPDVPLLALELSALYAGRTWDGYSQEEARGWRPEFVRVRFPRRPLPVDGSSPYYTVDVTLTATTGVVTGTYVQLDDDLTALAATGAPTNAAALATRAAERAADWLRKRGNVDRPLVRSWRDFQPGAVAAVGTSVTRVTFDDRGGVMRTWAVNEPDDNTEEWKPFASVPTAAVVTGEPDCTGCGWLAVFDPVTDCLETTVDGEPQEPPTDPGAPITVPIDEVIYGLDFDPTGPTLTLTPEGGGSPISGTFDCCACPCITFVFDRADFYTEDVPANVCDRMLRVRVCQTCCPIDGWTGDGWYCVRAAGTADPCDPVELVGGDECDDTIEVCSGPYATYEEAKEGCGRTPTEYTTPGSDTFIATSTTHIVECWGGGGGAGGSATGGGGGGEYRKSTVTGLTVGAGYAVVVGAGASAGTSSNGGASSFNGASVVANGGTGTGGTGTGGAGGTGGTGTTGFAGGNGGNFGGTTGGGGGGGAGDSGAGGNGGTGTAGTAGAGGGGAGGTGGNSANGTNGAAPGGGAGGGGSGMFSGGAAGNGKVKIT